MSITAITSLLFFSHCAFAQMQWTCASSSAGFPGRSQHASIVYDGKIWVFNGYGNNNSVKKDIWCSPDGSNWNSVADSVSYPMRTGMVCINYNEYMWIIGGYNGL